MMHIKICGLSTPETLDAAIDNGATHIGLVHFEKSPRHVSLEDAAKLRRRVPEGVKVVLVTVNAQPQLIAEAIGTVRPDILQFHGSETVEWIKLVKDKTGVGTWKALGLTTAEILARSARFENVVDRLLFDAPANALPGGNGTAFDWSLLAEYDHPVPWGMAGGLNPDNVAAALTETKAELVDVSSGVEREPGVKDVDRIAAFCEAVRDYDRHS